MDGPSSKLCRERNVRLVEDRSQAHGAKYKGKHLGTFGCIGAWSMCQDKIMTTGGGGMCVTDDEAIFKKMGFKDHGWNYELCMDRSIKWAPGYRYLCTEFGSNYRMTEMQAAIGRVFLRRLDSWVALRRRNASSGEAMTSDSLPCLQSQSTVNMPTTKFTST